MRVIALSLIVGISSTAGACPTRVPGLRHAIHRYTALKCATAHSLQINRELHIGNIKRAIAFDTLSKINRCRAMQRVAHTVGLLLTGHTARTKKRKMGGH